MIGAGRLGTSSFCTLAFCCYSPTPAHRFQDIAHVPLYNSTVVAKNLFSIIIRCLILKQIIDVKDLDHTFYEVDQLSIVVRQTVLTPKGDNKENP
jgi:hypothetical protein